jgi:phosphoribosylformylglycinamidine synthase
MMSNLQSIIPGAAHWPHFVKNKSEQFEARLAMVEVLESPSLFFNGMAGSKMPIAVAHGEGFAEFDKEPSQTSIVNNAVVNDLIAKKLVTMRFIDHASMPTASYPFNPNGSPQGITGLTSTDGRFSIMMPHPERVIRNVQNTWQRAGDSEDSAWLRMFRNARHYLG